MILKSLLQSIRNWFSLYECEVWTMVSFYRHRHRHSKLLFPKIRAVIKNVSLVKIIHQPFGVYNYIQIEKNLL